MKFTLELETGHTTYADLARHLARIVENWKGVNQKPEHSERIMVRECGEVIGEWRLEK